LKRKSVLFFEGQAFYPITFKKVSCIIFIKMVKLA
jgi:hypothetical protein